MKYQEFGNTGIEVSRLCLGTWQMGGEWGANHDGSIAAVGRAFELGVNFFDTAHMYGFGAAERGLAKGLGDLIKSRREELVIATKGGLETQAPADAAPREKAMELYRNSDPGFLRETLEQSLRNLGTDYVDVYFVHWPDPTIRFEETGAAMQAFVDEGLVRHVGVSNFSVEQIEAFERGGSVGAAQLPYSLLDRNSEEELFPFCAERGIGLMGWSALAHGLLTGAVRNPAELPEDDWRSSWPQFAGEEFEALVGALDEVTEIAAERGCSLPQLALAWVLANPSGVVPVIGAQIPAHVEDSVKAVDIELTAGEADRLAAILPTFLVGSPEEIKVRS